MALDPAAQAKLDELEQKRRTGQPVDPSFFSAPDALAAKQALSMGLTMDQEKATVSKMFSKKLQDLNVKEKYRSDSALTPKTKLQTALQNIKK
jgi:hypothetical protein